MTNTATGIISQGSYTPPSHVGSQPSARMLALTGLFAAVAIIAGIVAVGFIPDQLNVSAVDKALVQIEAHHRAEEIAGWMFAVGLAAVIPFTWLVVRTLGETVRTPATVGAWIITVGVTANVVGGLTMVALGHTVAPALADPAMKSVAVAFIGLGVAIDSMYNLSLGIGMLMIGRAMRHSEWPRWLANLALAAGALSLPVALEWYSPAAAVVQYASGTLYLVWAIGTSVVALRRLNRT
ncbi:MAG TPA: DUF4386 family protein [Gemmatimonadaceae bacterium]|nr:DUF4386 family protein [Gemmatimonadaceae bacterium]